MRSLRRRTKRLLGLDSVKQAHTGAVTFVQPFDPALRLNVHPRCLALDGVYVRDESGQLAFHRLPEPSAAEVAEVALRTAKRVGKVLERHGRCLEGLLQALTQLEQLILRDAQVSDLAPLSGLARLRYLGLHGTEVHDLEPLRGLSALGWLDLAATPVANLRPLARQTELARLDLAGSAVVDITPLMGLDSLQHLDLRRTQVSPQQVVALKQRRPGLAALLD